MNSPKYNRTFHFPWSKGATNDDKIAATVNSLINAPIIISEKMDGSNASLESTGCFARTHASAPTHASFDALKALHATIKYKIPNKYQLFGEWCYAKHSIEYSSLPGYFLLFNVRDLNSTLNMWLSWEEIELWAKKIGVPTVPILFKGTVSSEKELKKLVESLMIKPSVCGGIREGVVVRVQNAFADHAFSSSIMKCVRANHVQTSTHWTTQEIIKNKLK
jgi:hypothetical protein